MILALHVGLSAQSRELTGKWEPLPDTAEGAVADTGTLPLEMLQGSEPFELQEATSEVRLTDGARARRTFPVGGSAAQQRAAIWRDDDLELRWTDVVRLSTGEVTVSHVVRFSLQPDGTMNRVTESTDGRQVVRVSQAFRKAINQGIVQ